MTAAAPCGAAPALHQRCTRSTAHLQCDKPFMTRTQSDKDQCRLSRALCWLVFGGQTDTFRFASASCNLLLGGVLPRCQQLLNHSAVVVTLHRQCITRLLCLIFCSSIGNRVYFSRPTFLVLAEISLDWGVHPTLEIYPDRESISF